MAGDFQAAFLIVAAISALSIFVFARLSADAGAELSGRAPVVSKPTAEL